jgi:hypothetical protein
MLTVFLKTKFKWSSCFTLGRDDGGRQASSLEGRRHTGRLGNPVEEASALRARCHSERIRKGSLERFDQPNKFPRITPRLASSAQELPVGESSFSSTILVTYYPRMVPVAALKDTAGRLDVDFNECSPSGTRRNPF